MIKIAVVCDVLGQENNGTTIAALNLIRTMRAKGHNVRVVCPDEERAGEPGFYVVPRYRFGIFENYIRKNGVVVGRADREILDAALSGVDVIHVMTPFSIGKAAGLYAEAHGIPLTAGFHCQAENITGHLFLKDWKFASRVVYRILNRRLYRRCDCIHYPTQFICDTFESVVGSTPHRIISNGVSGSFEPTETERPAELRGKYVILYTARFSREKSHEILIDGVARSKHRDEIQLVFAGNGPLEEQILRRAERRKIPRPIIHFYSHQEMINVINWADLYVHPAQIEIESIACLEAIACGKVPLIANSPQSATRYFALTERNLFRYDDPADLAEKLDWWLAHPKEKEECAEKYRGYSAQFDFDRCMDRMEEMLLDAAGRKRP